jgi:hypothetical protein
MGGMNVDPRFAPMDTETGRCQFQFQILDLLILMALVAALLGSIELSSRYLPSISEMPPFELGNPRQDRNWFGQGGWAFAGYGFSLLIAAYVFKWFVFAWCRRRLTASQLFSFFIILSLPYVWFLCEPDWFNPFIYRQMCWIGGPIGVWFVPLVSFTVDLCSWKKARCLKNYVMRSGLEVLVVIPLWTCFWAIFSFFILGWGWI